MNSVVWARDMKRLAIGTQDAWIKILDPLTGFVVCETDVEAEVMCVAFHPFEEYLAASTASGKVCDACRCIGVLILLSTSARRYLFSRSSTSYRG